MERSGEMEVFTRVVKEGAMASAARSLKLTPSAVSKLITRLETRLGVRLLQRTTRALNLTQEGEVFYAAAKRIVGEIESLENQIVGESGTPSGVLRVTTSLTRMPPSVAADEPERPVRPTPRAQTRRCGSCRDARWSSRRRRPPGAVAG